ncbi:MAG: 2-C-methyl-D-erythritol 4-phosphate cytidylyltransferase [Bacteroidaceae bacterium]|jgi:2-C-methyl-D-erythritol 4-phosphate cytidylyltransferase|nr:2-C-methyl-D-erythritol 4-phosphate cytidylyltransferase [Bacteroidaceae bacterium]
MKNNKHIALLLAGGKSSRMNTNRPKQYIEVNGETVLKHTMKAFQIHPLIQDIYVVCAHGWEDTVQEEAQSGEITKFRHTIIGGDSSFQSLKNGINYLLQEIKDTDSIVLVHDAVRPLISQDIISRNIAVCLTHGNAITAVRSQEAFLISENGSSSNSYMPRENLLRAQTPHTFPLKTLKEMMDKANEKGITHAQSLFTLANELGFLPLHIAQGDIMNFKLTYPNDILIYQALRTLEE